MNPWLFSFLTSALLLTSLIDWRQVPVNIHGGVLSAVFMLADTVLGDKMGLFSYAYVGLNLPKTALFSDSLNIFLAAMAFNIGILIMQLTPQRLVLQFINAVVFGLFLFLFLRLAKSFDLYIIQNFSVFFVVRQMLLFLFLAWFKTCYLTGTGTANSRRLFAK